MTPPPIFAAISQPCPTLLARSQPSLCPPFPALRAGALASLLRYPTQPPAV